MRVEEKDETYSSVKKVKKDTDPSASKGRRKIANIFAVLFFIAGGIFVVGGINTLDTTWQ